MLLVRGTGTACDRGGGIQHHLAVHDPGTDGERGSAENSSDRASVRYAAGPSRRRGESTGSLARDAEAMETMAEPGAVVHLPFEWRSTEKLSLAPPVMPPIARYLMRHPWALQRFLNRTPPESGG